MISRHPTTSTPTPQLPLARLIEIIVRIFSISSSTPPNPVTPPESYHLIIANIPSIHMEAVKLVDMLLHRLKRGYTYSIMLHLLNELLFVFSNGGKYNARVQVAVYHILHTLFELIGPTLQPKEGKAIHDVLSLACDDLILPPLPIIFTSKEPAKQAPMLLTQPTSTYKKRKTPTYTNRLNTPQASASHADNFLVPSAPSNRGLNEILLYPRLLAAAANVLCVVLRSIPSSIYWSELRSKIERTMILTKNVEGILSAVTYPRDSKK